VSGIRESFAFAADGTRIYVRDRAALQNGVGARGAGWESSRAFVHSGVTTILCDGICCDGYIWKYLWDDLLNVSRLCHWHYRGHGRSAAPVDPQCIDVSSHARDLDEVRRHVGDGPVVLVGHSMGCQVALEAYRHRPERVVALVLLCGSSASLTQTFRGTDWLARVLPKLVQVTESHPGLMRGLWSRIPVQVALKVALATGEVSKELLDPDDLVPYLEHATHMDLLLFLRMLKAAGDYSADGFLPTVDVPALVIAGERDTFTPYRLAKEMALAMPKGQFVMIPGATHAAPLEHRELVAERIAEFIASAVRPAG
jgi:pimeloyl-ACP methyl ester carboxylesterase